MPKPPSGIPGSSGSRRPVHRYKTSPRPAGGAMIGTCDPSSFGRFMAVTGSNNGAHGHREVEVMPYGQQFAPPGSAVAARPQTARTRPTTGSQNSRRRPTPTGTVAMCSASARAASATRGTSRGAHNSSPSGVAADHASGVSGLHGGAGGPGVATMSAATAVLPRELMQRAVDVAREAVKEISLTQQSPFLTRCEKLGLEFIMEVAATDATQSMFVLRMQKTRGEAALFREMCMKILPHVKLGAHQC